MTMQHEAVLTAQERKTLDDAQAIIAAHTPEGKASWSFSFHSKGMFSSSCYFDSQGGQNMLWAAESLSDAVEAGIKCEREAEKDADKAKAIRIARLKEELRKLGEVAA